MAWTGYALLAATVLPRVAAGAILPWDDAYQRAEETLAQMNETLLYVHGLCPLQSFINGDLLQRWGATSTGATVWSLADFYIYYDPNCDGQPQTRGRWTFATTPPNTTAAADLDNDGVCGSAGYFESEDHTSVPLGTNVWMMRCDPNSLDFVDVSVTLAMVEGGEKLTLLKGMGWSWPPGAGFWDLRKMWYVGNTAPIPRLNIPSLNMQDAAAGFRSYWAELSGLATVWPSMLCIAATWDSAAALDYATAIGSEFAGKGANVILGPSVEVHRVARNGRNFEYISGEDPYLGARLAKAYVQGVQSQGVAAVVKHWVFNHQEENRGSSSSVVDERTKWELYYPPFVAAIEAGVSAAMCSYNRVDGEYSCSNKEQLTVLKEKMGFRGFVQSDWWASHSLSLADGLDQEMPGSGSGIWGADEFFSAVELMKVNQSYVDAAAKRVLAVMHRMDMFATAKCSPPNCQALFMKNVSTPAHAALARRLAAQSVVLLKNEAGLLPLTARSAPTIAIIGSAADSPSYDPNGAGQGGDKDWATGDYYSGGGSGHMAGNVITTWAGLRQRAADLGITVVGSLSNRVEDAVEAARLADVVIVVAGATSGESRDRPNLVLDDAADDVINAVSGVKPTVVLLQVPGAVVMPWRDSVKGIMAMFLGGQATGLAWADVLFGDAVPTGRLPVMMPLTEDDAIPPSSSDSIVYTEGMETSYRNKNFAAAFPFGHGLTYTTFEYMPAETFSCGASQACQNSTPCELCVRFRVRNAGQVAAPTVAQLYLEFPAEAGYPAPLLKGFAKTSVLAAGEAEQVTFYLEERDVSYYNVDAGGWVMASGPATAHVGESVTDIRQRVRLCLGSAGCSEGASQARDMTTWITIICLVAGGVLLVSAACGTVFYLGFRRLRKKKGGATAGEARTLDISPSPSVEPAWPTQPVPV